MLNFVCLVSLTVAACFSPVTDNNSDDPRDVRIKQFLKAPDREAVEQYLFRNPSRVVTLNDIMLLYRKQYNLDIAINYNAFSSKDRINSLLHHPIKAIDSRDKYIPRGLALQLYLDSFPADLTSHVQGGTIWIVPGKPHFQCEGKYCELGSLLRKTKPKYDDKLNREETNRVQIPPSDLLGAIRFFGSEERGNFRVFFREKELMKNALATRVQIPPYADKTYDQILRELLNQVNATYVVQDQAVVVVSKNGNGR